MPGFFSRWFGSPERSKPRGPDARDVTALAAPLATLAVHLIAVDSPSGSHFGGPPELPSGLAWPERAGTPLTFLVRASLADVRRAHRIDWLPDSGALPFFYDVACGSYFNAVEVNV